jgi:hypothetical protein
LNANIRDNVSFLANPPACRVSQAAFSLATSSLTAVTFGTEAFDTDTMHDTVTNTSRLTFTTAGLYTAGGWASFASNATSFRLIEIRHSTLGNVATQLLPPASGVTTDLVINTVLKVVAGSYIELMIQQNTGGSLAVDCVMWATWIGLG